MRDDALVAHALLDVVTPQRRPERSDVTELPWIAHAQEGNG